MTVELRGITYIETYESEVSESIRVAATEAARRPAA